MRNRALPSVMAFVAQAVGRRVLCYATANLLRDEADHMVPRFADYWKEQTGHYPARLLFDSRATIYAGLSQLTQRKVGFITIRRRGSGMLTRVGQLPADRWLHCQITQAKGKRRQVQDVDEWVKLDGYDGYAFTPWSTIVRWRNFRACESVTLLHVSWTFDRANRGVAGRAH